MWTLKGTSTDADQSIYFYIHICIIMSAIPDPCSLEKPCKIWIINVLILTIESKTIQPWKTSRHQGQSWLLLCCFGLLGYSGQLWSWVGVLYSSGTCTTPSSSCNCLRNPWSQVSQTIWSSTGMMILLLLTREQAWRSVLATPVHNGVLAENGQQIWQAT